MTLITKPLIAVAMLMFSTATFTVSTGAAADDCSFITQTNLRECDPPSYTWGLPTPIGVPTYWSLFDPYLLDIPGGEGKGMPVYSADDPSKIIGYMKIPAPQKPKGPVHCMIKETGLLAKSVDDCEAAGGTVAK